MYSLLNTPTRLTRAVAAATWGRVAHADCYAQGCASYRKCLGVQGIGISGTGRGLCVWAPSYCVTSATEPRSRCGPSDVLSSPQQPYSRPVSRCALCSNILNIASRPCRGGWSISMEDTTAARASTTYIGRASGKQAVLRNAGGSILLPTVGSTHNMRPPHCISCTAAGCWPGLRGPGQAAGARRRGQHSIRRVHPSGRGDAVVNGHECIREGKKPKVCVREKETRGGGGGGGGRQSVSMGRRRPK